MRLEVAIFRGEYDNSLAQTRKVSGSPGPMGDVTGGKGE